MWIVSGATLQYTLQHVSTHTSICYCNDYEEANFEDIENQHKHPYKSTLTQPTHPLQHTATPSATYCNTKCNTRSALQHTMQHTLQRTLQPTAQNPTQKHTATLTATHTAAYTSKHHTFLYTVSMFSKKKKNPFTVTVASKDNSKDRKLKALLQ